MDPDISIIVPVHNVELYLTDCINSIRSQSFKDLEIILVNDGSTDKSGKICDEFAHIDGRIKVIHKGYGGVSSARNAGISIARGKYIGFVDGDDRVYENMYQELYDLCVNTESDIAICKLGREIDGKIINEGMENFTKIMDHVEAMRQLFKGNLYRFSLCNKLFKRECFIGIEFPEGRIHEDLSTTYKLFSKSTKSVFTNRIGYIYVRRENSILTSRYNASRLDAFDGWNEILPFMSKNYPNLSSEVTSCFAYASIDNLLYIFHQAQSKEERETYSRVIQELIREHYIDILKTDTLPYKYKYMISLLNFNYRFLFLIFTLKHVLFKNNK